VIRQLCCAIAFLTRIPMPARVHDDADHLRESFRWFPLVGFLLGLLYAATAWLLHPLLSPGVLAVILVAEDAAATGALHLDGLADTADGFGGGHTREDALRIMRDHAIGSYGAVALVLALLLKTVCLSQLLTPPTTYWSLFVVPSLSRWAMVLLSCSEPYARDSATGSGALAQWTTRSQLLFASALCAILPFFFGWRPTLACWLSVGVTTLIVARVSHRKIHGITGDVLGANAVICEALQFVVAAAMLQRVAQ
jgi:adenosylcobinamide-GDP ribazoletransferase